MLAWNGETIREHARLPPIAPAAICSAIGAKTPVCFAASRMSFGGWIAPPK
jgi:hypothetical protein